jgi:3-deoxy-D-manno-octulosonic-acid transferase
MIRFLYNLLWPIGLIIFLPGYLVKMVRRGGYRENFGQRLGFYSAATNERLRKLHPTWIHAVSVGEIAIALKLAVQLRARQPDLRCVFTTTTTTGFAFARKSVPPWIEVLYSPLDFWPIMRRAFRRIAPRRVILIEAEVWPNLLAETRRQGAPVVLANARLSPRSEARFQRFHYFIAPLFRRLDLICVSGPIDAERWRKLGATPERIVCVGNIKYDAEEETSAGSSSLPKTIEFDATRPVLMGGSTHRGEERILADVFIELRREFPSLFLIVAPRHVERIGEIEAELRARGLAAIRRTSSNAPSADCLLIDTTGELRDWYGVGTVIFIGKSLTAHGGQNPVEAIIAGKPVLFGPHMENFGQLANELVVAGGAICVQTEEELRAEMRRLLRDAPLRARIVETARRVIAPHHGATKRTAAAITALNDRT